jgi:hypothetical protein
MKRPYNILNEMTNSLDSVISIENFLVYKTNSLTINKLIFNFHGKRKLMLKYDIDKQFI